MQIVASHVAMAASHYMHKEQSVEEHFLFWIGDSPPDQEGSQPATDRPIQDIVSISLEAQNKASESGDTAIKDSGEGAESTVDPKMQIIRRIMEAFTGREIKVAEFAPNKGDSLDVSENVPVSDDQREGWGLEYDYHEKYHETEQLDFSANGTVITADGKEISFSLEVTMSREFHESTSISIRAGDARLVDPLVINFDGQAADLTKTKFSFDLDADGSDEEISFVGPGSGFIVFDRNQDGEINDGSELFGPQTGHGFAELARYDADGNGWLDESDSIYDKLQVWNKGSDGNDQLFTLAEKNVGAIFLNSISSPFTLESQPGNLDGKIRESSIFIKEDGSAGTVQEIDLAV
jgi:hypothetical protein